MPSFRSPIWWGVFLTVLAFVWFPLIVEVAPHASTDLQFYVGLMPAFVMLCIGVGTLIFGLARWFRAKARQ